MRNEIARANSVNKKYLSVRIVEGGNPGHSEKFVDTRSSIQERDGERQEAGEKESELSVREPRSIQASPYL